MRWCAPHSTKRPVFCCRESRGSQHSSAGGWTSQNGEGRTRQGGFGAQDWRDPTSDVGRHDKLPMDKGSANYDAPRPSLTEGRTQLRSGPHKIRFVRSPVAGTMELVKPEDGQ